MAVGAARRQRFRFHVAKGRTDSPLAILSRVPVHCGSRGLPADRRHPHCLKHALGFALVAANVHLAIVKQALGHRNIASTAIYAIPTDEQTGKAVGAALAGPVLTGPSARQNVATVLLLEQSWNL
jgi:integrase